MKKLLTALVIIVSMATAGAVCAQGFQSVKDRAEQGNAASQTSLDKRGNDRKITW